MLRLCLAYMLKRGEFVAVPFSQIPTGLQQALYALLDKELIIRKDRSTDANDPTLESVNFIFDELRDYLISQHLIEDMFPNGLAKFNVALERFSPQKAPTEGKQRFLFTQHENPKTPASLSNTNGIRDMPRCISEKSSRFISSIWARKMFQP